MVDLIIPITGLVVAVTGVPGPDPEPRPPRDPRPFNPRWPWTWDELKSA